MSLRENVALKTPTSTLSGYLFVGQDGLPELILDIPHDTFHPYSYRPALFPANWQLQQTEPYAGILFCAWRTIMELQWEIAQQEREAEEAEDDAKERERERAIENAIAEELDHE